MHRTLALGAMLLPGVLVRGWKGSLSPWWPLVPAASDGEAHFEVLAVPTGPIGGIAVDPRRPMTVYLGGSTGLFRSTDGGATWSVLSLELPYPHILLADSHAPALLYAVRRDPISLLPLPGIYRSMDGGKTWQVRLVDTERISALAVDPCRRDTLYAGSWAGRLYRSSDGGERWTPCAPLPLHDHAPATVEQLLVNPLDGALYALPAGGGIFRSPDGGATWQQIYGDPGRLAIDPQRGDLYLAGRRLWRSGDDGKTWADLGPGPPGNHRGSGAAYWIAVNPQPLLLYTHRHRSDDGGHSWESLEIPPGFMPRLLLPGNRPILYGSLNGQAGRYLEGRTENRTPK